MEKIKKSKCVIVGAGTYGEVYASYLLEMYDVIGFVDDDENKWGTSILDIEILGDLNFLYESISRDVFVFVPLGNNDIRIAILEKLIKNGFSVPSFIHPDANIHKTVSLGQAVYILPGSRIMPLVVIKDFVMISLGVNIAHHSVLENGCFLSQGSNIGASITLKLKSYIGIGATIMTGVKSLGVSCLIGAGSVVIRDVENNAIVVGNPGKIIKYNINE